MQICFQKYPQYSRIDPRQPMLVSKSKPREVRAGQSDIIYLIPEVCRCTGLTESIRYGLNSSTTVMSMSMRLDGSNSNYVCRNDFKVMQDLAKHTRLTPALRTEALKRFIRRLIDEPKVSIDFSSAHLCTTGT